MDIHHIHTATHVGTLNNTAFTISQLTKYNELSRSVPVFFKVYDKNWSKDHLNTLICDTRFKSHDFIRKEWRLNQRFYGPTSSHNISTIQDLYKCIITKPKLLHLIKCMRLNKDVILKNDTIVYLALHSMEARKYLKNKKKIPLYKLNKLFSKVIPNSPKLIISNSKSNSKNHKPYTWNRFKYSRSILNNGLKQFSNQEKKVLIEILKS